MYGSVRPGPSARQRARGERGRRRLRFDGWIAGLGFSGGTRVVLGHWPRTPLGPFSDVMVERPDGERLLLAPSREVADFVAATYVFDTVRIVPVDVEVDTDGDGGGDGGGGGGRDADAGAGGRLWSVTAGPLALRFTVGRRGGLGLLLRAVPGALATRPAWCALTDGPARLLPGGVRTRGSAGGGRREWYGVRDLHAIAAASAAHEGEDLGTLTPVTPPVRFGFGSVPRKPGLARVVTTVDVRE
ncbi:hypothetical protein AB0A66_10800 [Streptomyces longwoodensis]|uniref:hypothetical protein n=1 Tax=Streptomyces longwoodensis TaxID=68231 RepID=UPI0033E1F6CE